MENRLTEAMPWLIAVRFNDYSKDSGGENRCCGRWTEYRWVEDNKWEKYYGGASAEACCSVCGSAHHSEKACESRRKLITTAEILTEMQNFKAEHTGDINFFTEIADERFADGSYYYKRI
ncbi:MAG: hypothetical protein LUD81_05840 [Clostridiales bacterium]|nr:hypothetical protein [Clostridiales bacterium]